MYIGRSESIRNPQYNPLDPDILLSTSLQTLSSRRKRFFKTHCSRLCEKK